MTRHKPRTPLTKILLSVLANLGDTVCELGSLMNALTAHYGRAYMLGGSEYVKELKQLTDKRHAKEILQRLQRSRLIKSQKIGRRLVITLTDKGRLATLAQRLKNVPRHKPNYFTIVIFDVPESQRSSRLYLRQLLKRGGFKLLQQSVWASDRDNHAEITKFIKHLNLERWVNVYHATKLLHTPRQ